MSFHLPLKSLKNQMIGPSLFHEPSIARTVKIVDDSNAHSLNRMSNFTSLHSDLTLFSSFKISLFFMVWESNLFLFQGNIYRMTDPDSLKATMDLAGRIRLTIEEKLSPGPSLCGIRRHGEKRRLHSNVGVASGNFLVAKESGVVEGIRYEVTGEVKKVDVHRIRERLDNDSIVILRNLGYSSSGACRKLLLLVRWRLEQSNLFALSMGQFWMNGAS
ncbi:putative amino-acid N-acetyltransferase [Helianthus anomalus]